MTLPLLARASENSQRFALTTTRDDGPPQGGPHVLPPQGRLHVRVPLRAPGAGEQYRFHVDMTACIGCKCCVVACNEQNGNPASINWRRVGEIEGGFYPHTERSYLSMACNHCLNPTCLSGCPVDAYTKDAATGLVLHSADACIGCQYCTWNCSYGVPQYNPERGVVGKCDMCHSRLELGQSPACVSACPTGAICVEIIDIAQWRASTAAVTPAPGVPAGDESLSTTRVTLPVRLSPNSRPVDVVRRTPGEPHWPLVLMTVLTQFSVGALGTIWLLQLMGASTRLGAAALTSLLVGAMALAASTLHLGRPIYAYRALKMWRRSWLSREVLLFTLFSVVACLYAGALWTRIGGRVLGGITLVLGAAGVAASACIYRVPSRPTWNTPFTFVQFTLTAAVLGPLFAAAIGAGNPRWLGLSAAAMAGTAIVALVARFFSFSASPSVERQAAARLLATVLASRLIARGILLAVGGMALPLYTSHPLALWTAFGLALSGEVLGRYLFFVSAVPRHMTAAYIGDEAA